MMRWLALFVAVLLAAAAASGMHYARRHPDAAGVVFVATAAAGLSALIFVTVFSEVL